MIVTAVGGKGGSGKSTLSLGLAVEAHRRGLTTLVVDLDTQGTMLKWAALAEQAKVPAPTVIAMGDAVRTQLPQVAANYDAVFIDCAGRISRRQVGSMMVSDIAIVPVIPRAFDAWELDEVATMIGDAQQLRPHLVARAVINQLRPGTVAGKAILDGILAAGLECTTTKIGLREDVHDSFNCGLGPTTYCGGRSAGVEFRRLFDEITDALGQVHGEAA